MCLSFIGKQNEVLQAWAINQLRSPAEEELSMEAFDVIDISELSSIFILFLVFLVICGGVFAGEILSDKRKSVGRWWLVRRTKVEQFVVLQQDTFQNSLWAIAKIRVERITACLKTWGMRRFH